MYQHGSALITSRPGITELDDLTVHSIIRVTRFQTCSVNRNNATGGVRKIILVITYDLLTPGVEVGGLIGTPTNVEEYMDRMDTQGAGRISNGAVSNAVRPSPGDVSLQEGLTFPINSLSPYQNR